VEDPGISVGGAVKDRGLGGCLEAPSGSRAKHGEGPGGKAPGIFTCE
jgi:hypothetical protein